MTRILWLRPDKPENISVGRHRLVSHLDAAGFEITLEPATPQTLLELGRTRPDYDIVIGTTRAGAILGTVLKLATGTPLIVDHIDPIRQFAETHPDWLTTVVRHLEQLAFRVADHTLYVYPEEQARVDRFARAATRTQLGVDFERFADPDSEIVARASDRLADHSLSDRTVIYVGGLEPIYNIDALLGSLDHLDGWSLVVLGSGSLDEEVTRVASQRDDLIFLGTVPHEEIPGYLHVADVGVSLVDDPHTLKVLEYGAARLPTVQLAGRAEGRFGDAVTYCEPEAASIATAIQEASEQDPTALHDLVESASWASIAETYRTVIGEI